MRWCCVDRHPDGVASHPVEQGGKRRVWRKFTRIRSSVRKSQCYSLRCTALIFCWYRCNNASSITATLFEDIGIKVGEKIFLEQQGSGNINLLSGGTANVSGTLSTNSQNQVLMVLCVSRTNEDQGGNYISYPLIGFGGGGGGDPLPNGAFEVFSNSNLTVNPIKEIRNNFLWNIFNDGSLSFDLTNVSDGATGNIVIQNGVVVNPYRIDIPTGVYINNEDIREDLSKNGLVITVLGAVNNGSGFVRLTTTPLPLSSGTARVRVQGVSGTIEANGDWTATIVNSTTVDLPQQFLNAFTGNGQLFFLENYLGISEESNGVTQVHFIVRGSQVHLNLRKGYELT